MGQREEWGPPNPALHPEQQRWALRKEQAAFQLERGRLQHANGGNHPGQSCFRTHDAEVATESP